MVLNVTQKSEYNYIPGYIIEDESNDTSHEIGTLEAVDSEILGDYDATQGTKRDATTKIRRS
jgi:hypothetical protein